MVILSESTSGGSFKLTCWSDFKGLDFIVVNFSRVGLREVISRGLIPREWTF